MGGDLKAARLNFTDLVYPLVPAAPRLRSIGRLALAWTQSRLALRILLTVLGYDQTVNFCFIDEESTYEYLCDPGY